MKPLFLASLFVAPGFLDAAIVARFLAPGEVFERIPFDFVNHIDLDGDGTRDFYTSTRRGMATIIPEGNNRVLSIDARPPDLGWSILPLSAGELIGDASVVGPSWRGLADRVNQFDLGGAYLYQCLDIGVGFPVCSSFIEDGNVVNYVGLEFEINGETHYGWVGLGLPFLDPNHTIDVYAWAYETEPGRPIGAGAIPEPGVGVLALVSAALAGFGRRRRAG